MVNRQVWVKSRPTGIPQGENFAIRDGKIPTISQGEYLGEYLVRIHYLSADRAMRGWILDSGRLRGSLRTPLTVSSPVRPACWDLGDGFGFKSFPHPL